LPAPPPDPVLWFQEQVLPFDAALRAFLLGRFTSLGQADREDIVQETYARLLQAHAERPILDPKPYAFTIARNLACLHFRQAASRRLEPMRDSDAVRMVEESRNAADHVAHEQELALLREAICSLPPKCREVFVLAKLQRLSHAEISQKLSLSVKTIGAHLHRGIAHCRAYLKERGLPS
jgi:RNA polymerase sigma-70 factor (ECF subfamily)